MFRNSQISAEELKKFIELRLKDLDPTIILDVTDDRTSLAVEASQNGATFNVKSEFSTSRVNRPKIGNRQEILLMNQATPRPTTQKAPPTTKARTTKSTTTTREPKVIQRDIAPQPRTTQTHSAVRPLPKPFRSGQCGGVIHVDGHGEKFFFLKYENNFYFFFYHKKLIFFPILRTVNLLDYIRDRSPGEPCTLILEASSEHSKLSLEYQSSDRSSLYVYDTPFKFEDKYHPDSGIFPRSNPLQVK